MLAGDKYKILGTLLDTGKNEIAQRNAEDAINSYPEMNAMVGLFAYNPPACYQALQKAGKWTDEPTVTLEPLTPVPRKGAENTHAARARESAERAKMSYKRILLTIVPRSGPSPLR